MGTLLCVDNLNPSGQCCRFRWPQLTQFNISQEFGEVVRQCCLHLALNTASLLSPPTRFEGVTTFYASLKKGEARALCHHWCTVHYTTESLLELTAFLSAKLLKLPDLIEWLQFPHRGQTIPGVMLTLMVCMTVMGLSYVVFGFI